jgi:TetR/AcrR family transcriptional regulator, mexJK operon transcriptional repressor
MAEIASTTVDSRRGRGRPKTADDSIIAGRIVEAARDCFLGTGYEDTTMDMVARQAGVSKRTVYRLFAGKQILFGAVIAGHRQSMLDLPRPDDGLPLVDALMAIFRVDLDLAAVSRRDALTRLFVTESRRHPELAPFLSQHGSRPARDLLTEWLQRQVVLGRITVPDPRSAANLLINMALGPITFGEDGQPQWPAPSERKSHVVNAVDVFLHGVVPRGRDDAVTGPNR